MRRTLSKIPQGAASDTGAVTEKAGLGGLTENAGPENGGPK